MPPLLVFIGCLIVYGSLYPFNFSAAAPDAIARLFSNWRLLTSLGDLLGNVGLFAPWGLVGMQVFLPRWGWQRAAAITACSGLLVSFGAQVLQIWVPSRDAALADVIWNLVGIAIGAIAGRYVAIHQAQKSSLQRRGLVPTVLLSGMVLMEWLPLVPSLDLQLVKDALKSIWATPTLSAVPFFPRVGIALLAGHLLADLWGIRKSLVLLPFMMMALVLGKLFLHAVQIDLSAPLGFALGTALWWTVARSSVGKRDAIVLFALFLTYTAGALAPLSFRDEAAAVSWLPFAAMLEGSMLSNVRSLVGNVVVFAGMLCIVAKGTGRSVPASIGLALWVLLLELMQTLIETRSADLTEPLLVLLVGQVLDTLQRARSSAPESPNEKSVVPRGPHAPAQSRLKVETNPKKAQPQHKLIVIQLVVAVAAITMSMAALLKLPGVPYNVKELFRADANVFALICFSLALLWSGAGAVWLASRLASSRLPALQLPPLVLLVSLISLSFLWSGVTTESIEDISGSSNVFWFVTNRDTWGTTWREIFLYLDAPQVIGFLEHCVRYSALYAPLPIFLALMMILRKFLGNRHESKWRIGALMVSALALLWLCKAIAFDWTSTDNLNELITRDGEWGWGGGGFLYGLLLLLCLNGMILAESASSSKLKLGFALFLSVAAIPLGWWLLNQGLEQHVEKYSSVFSGTQFLLGPDRQHLLSPEILFLRWCVVQCGGVMILSAGIWLGQRLFHAPTAALQKYDAS